MPLHDLSIADPPVGSQLTIQVTISNTGTREGNFFIHGITSIVEGEGFNFGDIAGGENFQGLNAIPDTFGNVTNIVGRSGDIGIITLLAETEADVQFLTPALEIPGIYEVGIQAGTYDPETNQVLEIQDTIVAENIFEMYIPPTAELSNAQVV